MCVLYTVNYNDNVLIFHQKTTKLKNKEKEECVNEKPLVKVEVGYLGILSEHLTDIFKGYCIIEANILFICYCSSLGSTRALKNGSEGCRSEWFTRQGHFTNHHKMEVITRVLEFVL